MGCLDGWGFHSRGCSVHSSHRLPWGLPLSAAAGCHPGNGGEEDFQRKTSQQSFKMTESRIRMHVSLLQIQLPDFFFFILRIPQHKRSVDC